MITSRRLFISTAISGAVYFGAAHKFGGLAALAQTGAQTKLSPSHVQAYVFRGLADVFSLGMNVLTDRLRGKGYSANVYKHNRSESIAGKIVDRYSRHQKEIVVLIGHSLGADTAVRIAHELDRANVPVELVVTFDGTLAQEAPRNVLNFVNLYVSDGFNMRVTPAPGFQGELTNIDLNADTSLTHVTIDDSDRLHSYVLGKIAVIVDKDLAKRVQASKPKKKRPANNG